MSRSGQDSMLGISSCFQVFPYYAMPKISLRKVWRVNRLLYDIITRNAIPARIYYECLLVYLVELELPLPGEFFLLMSYCIHYNVAFTSCFSSVLFKPELCSTTSLVKVLSCSKGLNKT